MLHRSDLHDYQVKAVDHMDKNPLSMIWLDLGLGKTISTLTSIVDRMASMEVYGALVIAPVRVTETVWAQEAAKWSHTNHLSFSLIRGTPAKRELALCRKSNVYLVNYEGLQWAIPQFINHYLAAGKPLPFNMVVCDEITRLKSTRTRQGGAWGKALRQILEYVPYRAGLTATPAPNGLQDLFGQYLVVDDGKRLGTSYNNFQSAYFKELDPNGYKIQILPHGEEFIKEAVSDITIQMKGEDHLKLPPVVVNDVCADFTPKVRKQYDQLEKEMMLHLDSGTTVDVDTAAIMSGKCRQLTAGAMYTDEVDRTKWEEVHKIKLDMLKELIDNLNGSPLLLSYQFKHDAERISKMLEKSKIKFAHFNAKVKGEEVDELMRAWNNYELPVLMGHCLSIGHGLNLQYSCNNVCWYGLPWSMEGYKQLNGRVARQGQTKPVMIHRLTINDTVDTMVARALERKTMTEDAIRESISEYRKQRGY